MTASKETKQASKGTVQLRPINGRLQLRFSYGGKRHYLSLGLEDNPVNRKLAEMKARQIELDIISDNYTGLDKYKQNTLSVINSVDNVIPIKKLPTLDELWEKFTNFRWSQLAPSTQEDTKRFESHIKKLPTKNINDAIQIRDFLIANYSPDTAKRCLVQFSGCCSWAVDSKLIAYNPFKDMAASIDVSKRKTEDNDINPFTKEERDLIIQAFSSNYYYNYYTNFLKALFFTGARSSEIIGLTWVSISNDFRYITFFESVTRSPSGLVKKKGLKTQEKRRFPCNNTVQTFFKSIKPEDAKPDDLIFPSPEGKFIDFHNFRNRAWKNILDSLDIPYRNPYQTRHTFINLMLENGLDAKDVARLVGNSAATIYNNYAGNKRDLFVPDI